mmetsp:Transcript_1769/g.3821  ORF Transcript_1769/g.3821 Transcript_1769/m.3821 type:complete len:337 (-) Transcript_1769:68-1078(-)
MMSRRKSTGVTVVLLLASCFSCASSELISYSEYHVGKLRHENLLRQNSFEKIMLSKSGCEPVYRCERASFEGELESRIVNEIHSRYRAFSATFCPGNKNFELLSRRKPVNATTHLSYQYDMCYQLERDTTLRNVFPEVVENEEDIIILLSPEEEPVVGEAAMEIFNQLKIAARKRIYFEITSDPKGIIKKFDQVEKGICLMPGIFGSEPSQNGLGIAAFGVITNGGVEHFRELKAHLQNTWVSRLKEENCTERQFGIVRQLKYSPFIIIYSKQKNIYSDLADLKDIALDTRERVDKVDDAVLSLRKEVNENTEGTNAAVLSHISLRTLESLRSSVS